MIIINSDDFGYSSEVNRTICLAFERSLISSTTSLVNFESGLNDAVMCVESRRIDRNAVGLHLNLTDGRPLTDPIRRDHRFCRNGEFFSSGIRSLMVLDRESATAAYRELEAQLNRFVAAFGFHPSHIDSHHHIHNAWAVSQLFEILAVRHKIRSVRIARNLGRPSVFPKKLYKSLLNHRLARTGLVTTAKFGDVADLAFSGVDPNKSYEIMVHALPGRDENEIMDIDNINLDLKIKSLGLGPFELKNYHDLQRTALGKCAP